MNFSAISEKSLSGRLLRFAGYHLVPGWLRMPIMQGASRGMKWIVGSHVPACWLGCYEFGKREQMEQAITPGSTVYDIGAHCGFFTLLSASLVGPTGHVVAFEPLPANLRYLREHVRLNQLANVTVMDAAVSDQCGTAWFDDVPERSSRVAGHLTAQGTLEVKTVALDALIEAGELPPPDFLKIDAEGAEMLILTASEHLITTRHPTVFLDAHGRKLHGECMEFLAAHGYDVRTTCEEIFVLDDGTERFFGEMIAVPTPTGTATEVGDQGG